MSALAFTPATGPTRGGATVTAGAVGSTDTISRAKLGVRGVILEIINGNVSADTVTVSDASTTPTGGAAAAISKSVAGSANAAFEILPGQADRVTGDVTVTHTVTATVTYKMYPRD